MKLNKEQTTNLLLGILCVAAGLFYWETTKAVLIFLVTLGILIAVHEWGHFIAARSAGVTVHEFALGMGPKLVTYMRRHGTDYTIRAVPIGGFVLPKGMRPEDPVTPDGLNGRRASERALVYLAGPLMNIVFALLVAMSVGFLFGVGDPSVTLVGDVARKRPAARMDVVSVDGKPAENERKGLRVGDRILAVDDVPITEEDQVVRLIHPRIEQPVSLKVLRDGRELVLQGTTERRTQPGKYVVVQDVPPGTKLDLRRGDQVDAVDGRHPFEIDGRKPVEAVEALLATPGKEVRLRVWRVDHPVESRGVAGKVRLALEDADRTVGALGFTPVDGQGGRTSLGESVQIGLNMVVGYVQRLVTLFSRPKVLSENLSGPLGIFAQMRGVDRLPATIYCSVLISLSISLAVFNLLPIPLLDGGHMAVLTVEVLRRRRLEPETHYKVQLAGLMIVGALFVIIIGRDVLRHIL